MNKQQISYTIALITYLLQYALLAIGQFDRPDIEIDSWKMLLSGLIILSFKALPWLVLIPGLIIKHPKIMAWMSYVCLVYFIIWVLGAFGTDKSGLATWGIIVTLIQFTAAATYTRLNKRKDSVATD